MARLLLVLLWSLLGAHGAQGTTVHVTSSSNPGGDGSSGNPYDTLSAAVGSGADSIVLFSGVFNLGSTTISGGSRSISGSGGTVLSSLGAGPHLNITGGATVSLSLIKFFNGSSTNGGAIQAGLNSTVTVDRCEFEFNRASQNGGAIFTDSGALQVSNSNFTSNTVASSQLEAEALGGAIAMVGGSFGALAIQNSTFANNSVTSPLASQGGALAMGGSGSPLSVRGCAFRYNTALYGGALSLVNSRGASELDSCTFEHNRAQDTANGDGMPAYGGATHFQNSTATLRAGVFSSNQAATGGALMARLGAAVSCSACTLKGNQASRFGGSLAAEASGWLALSGSEVSNSSATKGGALYVKSSSLSSSDTNYSFNSATETAGFIYLVTTQAIAVSDATVSDNQANSAVGGGALYSDSDHQGALNFTRVRFSGNRAPAGPGGAAVLYGQGSAEYSFEQCSFVGNSALQMGGAVALWAAKAAIKGSIFQGNTVGPREQGSALYMASLSTPSISGSEFSSHSESTGSPVLLIENSSPVIQSTTFTRNNGHASVVRVLEAAHPTFLSSHFTHNTGTSLSPSSALLLDGFGNATVTNCSFSDNASPAGAALTVGVRAVASLSGCVFERNRVSGSGGALMLNSSLTATSVHSCLFQHNRADMHGGALFLSPGAACRVLECSHTNNTAAGEGGALFAGVGAAVQIQHSKFHRNNAHTYGGALSLSEATQQLSASWPMQADSEFVNNYAEHGGGAVYWHIGTPQDTVQTCSSCTYSANAVGAGGYGPDRASEVSTVQYPSSSQHLFVPGNPSDNTSFYLQVVDKFNQVVASPSGSGIQCKMSWASVVSQYAGDTVRFSVKGLLTYPEVRIAAVADSAATNSFRCTYARCSATDPSVVQHTVDITGTVQIDTCLVGQYREMEQEIYVDSNGLNQLRETGRVKNCVTCAQGTYSKTRGVTQCKQCPLGASCPGGDKLIPKAGYWKPYPSHDQVYKCDKDGCLGGVNSTCKLGYHGKVCGVCDARYAVFGHSCESCSASSGVLKLYTPVVLLGVCLVLGIFVSRDSKQDAKAKQFLSSQYKQKLHGMAMVIISFCQILALLITTISGVPWPEAFRTFVAVLRFSQLNLFDVLPLECYRDEKFSFYDSMVCSFTLVALVLLYYPISLRWKLRRYPSAAGAAQSGGVATEMSEVTEMTEVGKGTYTPRSRPARPQQDEDSDEEDFTQSFEDSDSEFDGTDTTNSGGEQVVKDARTPTEKQRDRIIGEHVKHLLVCLFVLYPGTCSQALHAFFCRKIDGRDYLVADVTQECFVSSWVGWAILSAGVVLVFLVGLPLCSLVFLSRNKDMHTDPGFVKRFGSLYNVYKPELWRSLSTDCLRKFLLVGVIVFFSPGSPTQTAMAFCMAYFFTMAQIKFRPYIDSAVNRMQLISESTLAATLFAGLGLQAHLCKDEGGASKTIVTVFLIATNVLAGGMMISLVCQYILKQARDIKSTRKAVLAWDSMLLSGRWRHWRLLYLSENLGSDSSLSCTSTSLSDDSDSDFDIDIDHNGMFGSAVAADRNPLGFKQDVAAEFPSPSKQDTAPEPRNHTMPAPSLPSKLDPGPAQNLPSKADEAPQELSESSSSSSGSKRHGRSLKDIIKARNARKHSSLEPGDDSSKEDEEEVRHSSVHLLRVEDEDSGVAAAELQMFQNPMAGSPLDIEAKGSSPTTPLSPKKGGQHSIRAKLRRTARPEIDDDDSDAIAL